MFVVRSDIVGPDRVGRYARRPSGAASWSAPVRINGTTPWGWPSIAATDALRVQVAYSGL